MNKFGKELVESMTEACEHAEGKTGRVRVHVVDCPRRAGDPPAAAAVADGIRARVPDGGSRTRRPRPICR